MILHSLNIAKDITENIKIMIIILNILWELLIFFSHITSQSKLKILLKELQDLILI